METSFGDVKELSHLAKGGQKYLHVRNLDMALQEIFAMQYQFEKDSEKRCANKR